MKTNQDEFRYIFQELCDNDHPYLPECQNNIEDVQEVLDSKLVDINMDIHYYEGIMKYNLFFAGWNDNDSAYIEENDNYEKLEDIINLGITEVR